MRTRTNCQGEAISRYRKGAVANTTAAINITRRRPTISDRMPAGRLTMIPTTVDAAAIKPTVEMGTPIERINNGSAGFLAIVELKMASPPIMHKSRKGDSLIFIVIRFLLRALQCFIGFLGEIGQACSRFANQLLH